LHNQIDISHDNKDNTQKPILRNNFEAYQVIPATAPKLNIDSHLNWLTEANKIDNIWTYRNQKGELIGGTIRVVDKVTGKKQVMPVSYCHNNRDGADQWRLKGFLDNGYKPIYGIEKLANEKKPVLIVEGEKTADFAQALLPEYSVISWMGGAQGTAKVNWRQLVGREVTIWPDNDQAGGQAAKSILHEINKVNGFTGLAGIVDTESLNLPEKWDLADKIPEHLSLDGIKEAITSCQNKGKNIISYIEKANQHNDENEQRIFWQQTSIGINSSIESTKRKVSNYELIHERVASTEIASYMNYATVSGRDEVLHKFLNFDDSLYQEMVTSTICNYLAKYKGSEYANQLKHLFGRDEDGNQLATPKEIIKEIHDIYDKVNSEFNVCSFTSLDKYIKNNQQLAARDPAKAELHQGLMKDFCILHQEQLGMSDLGNAHKERLSENLYKIITSYKLNEKGSDRALKDSDLVKIAELAHNKINNANWWQDLVKDQIKLAKTSKIEILTESEKKLKVAREEITIAMEELGVKGSATAILARAEGHYLEYMHGDHSNLTNKDAASKSVQRAIYEEKNIIRCQANVRHYLIEDKKFAELKTASGKLYQELVAEKFVRAESYINNTQPDLTIMQIRKIVKELVYDNYEQEIDKVIKDEPAVSVLHKQNPIAARYLAESLVDFKNNYGEELLTESRTRIMEGVAITQADLHEKINDKMQGLDDKILDGKHKSLSNDILDSSVLAGDREMTAKSVTSQVGEDLTHDMLLRGNTHYEQLHDHPEYHNHNTKIDHDSHNGLEHDYQHEITTRIQQTRTMQHEYHDRMEQEHERQININNDININY
jgi:Domain of unknown function (DUF6371)